MSQSKANLSCPKLTDAYSDCTVSISLYYNGISPIPINYFSLHPKAPQRKQLHQLNKVFAKIRKCTFAQPNW